MSKVSPNPAAPRLRCKKHCDDNRQPKQMSNADPHNEALSYPSSVMVGRERKVEPSVGLVFIVEPGRCDPLFDALAETTYSAVLDVRGRVSDFTARETCGGVVGVTWGAECTTPLCKSLAANSRPIGSNRVRPS